MVRRRGKKGKCPYAGLEAALTSANRRHIISCRKTDVHQTRALVEQIVTKIVKAMKQQSGVFRLLYRKNFGGGSIYDGLKIGAADEFDIDILLEMPAMLKPVLVEDGVAGFAQLQLKNFHRLRQHDPETYRVMKEFVDGENYLLPKRMKSAFMQSIFDKTIHNVFPDGTVNIGTKKYRISRVQTLGPAFTLTLNGPSLNSVAVDLVPSILLNAQSWPTYCRGNPFPSKDEFFLAPTGPKQDHYNKQRFWRLSFHMQERQIIFHRFWMKPAIRVLKCLRDYLEHKIKSYDIKTVFLWELYNENPALDQETPVLFKKSLGFIVVYMLEKYLGCLKQGTISDFWNPNLNLLSHLSQDQLEQYASEVSAMLLDIKANPTADTLLKYLG